MVASNVIIIFANVIVLVVSAALDSSVICAPKEAIKYSLCPSVIKPDENPHRIPRRIEHIICKEDVACSYCYKSYQCVQLQSSVEVAYLDESLSRIQSYGNVAYNSGCVCANIRVNRAADITDDIVN